MVYFMQGQRTGLIKIGWTANLKKRLACIQTDSPDRIVVLGTIMDKSDDAPYHSRFREAREHGEWFRPSPKLRAFIKRLSKAPIRFAAKSKKRLSTIAATPPVTDFPICAEPNIHAYQAAMLRSVKTASCLLKEYCTICFKFGEAAGGRFVNLLCQQKQAYYAAIESGGDALTNFKTALVHQVTDEYGCTHAN